MPGVRFNSRIGGKGSLSYLIGFDEDFAKKAQVHVTYFAKQKRERRIAHRSKSRWANASEAALDAARRRSREHARRKRSRKKNG